MDAEVSMHTFLTMIIEESVCFMLCAKADFKSKSQNVLQQIILFSWTVMQRICTWPKIWTLSGRLSLMRNVQLMKKNNNIFRVFHIRIIAKKNWFTRHVTDRFLKNLCQECVRAYFSIHDCLSCDLLLKSAFERIFNVMQLILVNIKWHIKWKYLIQKFHDICLSICHINARSLYAFDKDLKSQQIILFSRMYSNAKDMRVTQDLNSFGEIIAHAQCSVDEKK
jgi:hypothetical protein